MMNEEKKEDQTENNLSDTDAKKIVGGIRDADVAFESTQIRETDIAFESTQ